MTASFVSDREIAAGLLPFRAMRRNSMPPGAKLCEQMCQLVAKRAIDFTWVLREFWI
jgi:hypothetical protein